MSFLLLKKKILSVKNFRARETTVIILILNNCFFHLPSQPITLIGMLIFKMSISP